MKIFVKNIQVVKSVEHYLGAGTRTEYFVNQSTSNIMELVSRNFEKFDMKSMGTLPRFVMNAQRFNNPAYFLLSCLAGTLDKTIFMERCPHPSRAKNSLGLVTQGSVITQDGLPS